MWPLRNLGTTSGKKSFSNLPPLEPGRRRSELPFHPDPFDAYLPLIIAGENRFAAKSGRNEVPQPISQLLRGRDVACLGAPAVQRALTRRSALTEPSCRCRRSDTVAIPAGAARRRRA